jgi:hypothetical protein
MPINAKQEAFCQEYVKDHNATDAYRRAGYNSKSPDVDGPNLLGKPGIKNRIAELTKPIQAKAHLDAVAILHGIENLALNGKTDSVRLRAYDLLAKRFGLFPDRIITEEKPLYDSAQYDILYNSPQTLDHQANTETSDTPPLLPSGFKELPNSSPPALP